MNEDAARCRLGRGHSPVLDAEIGYFCPGCGELFSPGEVREYLAGQARRRGMQGREGLSDGDGNVLMSADPAAIEDPELALVFLRAMNARPVLPAHVRLHFLAWSGIPGRDWAPAPSQPCREPAYRRCGRDRARFRRLRACVRHHPTNGPNGCGRSGCLVALVRGSP